MFSWLFYGRFSDGVGEEGSCMWCEIGGESERFRRKKKIKRSFVVFFYGFVSFVLWSIKLIVSFVKWLEWLIMNCFK